MNVLIIDNGTRHLGRLKNLLKSNNLTIINFTDKIISQNFDLAILTGNSIFPLFFNQDLYNDQINLVKNSNKPIIGICFGCELIAYALGAKIEKLNHKVKGIKQIEILDNSIDITTQNNFNVYESHGWAITELNEILTGLAKSKFGYEIIKHKNKPIFGLQFHPEMFVEETLGDEIFTKILGRINQS